MSSPTRGEAPAWAGPTAPPWSVLALLPPQFASWYKNYYAYAGSQLTLGVSATAVVNIAIQNDAYFVWLASTMVETASGDLTVLTYRPITVQVFDSGAGSNVFSQPVMCDEVFGESGAPGLLAFPYIFQPGGNMAVTLVNLEAVARNVRFTLHGFKCNPKLTMEEVYNNPTNRW